MQCQYNFPLNNCQLCKQETAKEHSTQQHFAELENAEHYTRDPKWRTSDETENVEDQIEIDVPNQDLDPDHQEIKDLDRDLQEELVRYAQALENSNEKEKIKWRKSPNNKLKVK